MRGLSKGGERIRRRRDELGLSQADLGRLVGVSQATIEKIEKGLTDRSKFLPSIAVKLGIPLGDIDETYARLEPEPAPARPPAVMGQRDWPIYASAEGGPGQIIRSADPVDWAPRPAPVARVGSSYGLNVIGESMFPEYKAGEVAIVDPSLPPIGHEVHIFYAVLHGEPRATIKLLRRATQDHWHVTQWNPPDGGKRDFMLSRKEWTICHRVVGKYTRR